VSETASPSSSCSSLRAAPNASSPASTRPPGSRHRHDIAPETCTPCHCDLPNLPDAINYLNAHRPACTGPHTIYKVAVARLATTPGKKAS